MNELKLQILKTIEETTDYTADVFDQEKIVAELSKPVAGNVLYPRFTLLALGPWDNSHKSINFSLIYKADPEQLGVFLGTWKTPLKDFTPEKLTEFLEKSEERLDDLGKGKFGKHAISDYTGIIPGTFNNGVDPFFFGDAKPLTFEDRDISER